MKLQIGQAYSFRQLGLRDNQEDARYPDVDHSSAVQRFFIVCDGVGGTAKGELASNTVCKAFAHALRKTDFTANFTNEDFSRALDEAFDALDKQQRANPDSDFATTLAFAAFHGGGCTLAHIGDSRIYQIRPAEGIVYQSEDHSLVNQMVRNGLISPDEAENHPQSHVITRSMSPANPDENRSKATIWHTTDVKPGDCFLLCTDGVYNCLTDEELTSLVSLSKNPEEAIQWLAALCSESADNNTAYLITIEDADEQEDLQYSEDCRSTCMKTHGTSDVSEIQSLSNRSSKGGFKNFIQKIFPNK